MVELAFSILAADFAHLADEIAAAERGGGTIVHVDVMDGHFVPNITFGPPVVKAVRKVTKLPLDCHLMIENPDAYIPEFAAAGADMISVHQEVCRHLHRSLQLIADHGMKPGVVINPGTPVDSLIEVLPMVHHVLVMSVNPGFGGQKFLPFSLEKMAYLAELRHEMELNFRIEVDGGVAHDTVGSVVEAGAEMLVAGSAIFGPGGAEANGKSFLAAAREAEARMDEEDEHEHSHG
ncbi:ribulose-phosphate 3-epimerase [Granulicella aggregans]|jgi:ribulose-phosphate 3-epimerase|uniref:ribulose-phosphate 3-epimerase n=1 Tax=Granulicella aggregans TaxID=474949 RepID=UPI0021E0420C|nr:ribulose-phosphate 3-epimerase [Granulicella aggregans]